MVNDAVLNTPEVKMYFGGWFTPANVMFFCDMSGML